LRRDAVCYRQHRRPPCPDLDDRVVIEAVNDIEMLATNLSRRIWHKLAVLEAVALGEMPVKAAK
jgi:hypothetical protein